MKFKRYLLGVAAMLLLVTGCSSGGSTQAGRIEKISAAELLSKKSKNETFAFVITQTTCNHCITFLNMLNDYLPDHNVLIYDVVLDKESNFDQALKELENTFPKFKGTPDIYYIENGEVKSRFWDEELSSDGLNEKTFNSWVKEYNLEVKE